MTNSGTIPALTGNTGTFNINGAFTNSGSFVAQQQHHDDRAPRSRTPARSRWPLRWLLFYEQRHDQQQPPARGGGRSHQQQRRLLSTPLDRPGNAAFNEGAPGPTASRQPDPLSSATGSRNSPAPRAHRRLSPVTNIGSSGGTGAGLLDGAAGHVADRAVPQARPGRSPARRQQRARSRSTSRQPTRARQQQNATRQLSITIAPLYGDHDTLPSGGNLRTRAQRSGRRAATGQVTSTVNRPVPNRLSLTTAGTFRGTPASAGTFDLRGHRDRLGSPAHSATKALDHARAAARGHDDDAAERARGSAYAADARLVGRHRHGHVDGAAGHAAAGLSLSSRGRDQRHPDRRRARSPSR